MERDDVTISSGRELRRHLHAVDQGDQRRAAGRQTQPRRGHADVELRHGASVSFFLSGLLGAAFDWRTTYLLLAVEPFVGWRLIAGLLPARLPAQHDALSFRIDFRRMFHNRRPLA